MPGEQKNKKNWLAEIFWVLGVNRDLLQFWHFEPIIIYRKVQIINYDLHQNIIFLWKKNHRAYQVSNIFRQAWKTKAEKQAQ